MSTCCFMARRVALVSRAVRYCSSTTRAPSVSASDESVQKLLLRMTGQDFERLYAARKQELNLPQYRLLSEEQLREAHEQTTQLAEKKLKPPPILKERKPMGAILQEDRDLENFDSSNWIFTNITQECDNESKRRIVVREPSGNLREAVWDERDRMTQVYFRKPGKKMWLPTMLQADHLPSVLNHREPIEILDVVALQCDPDSADYIRVHQTVYEHIEKAKLYDKLRSTRYFGGLVWYLIEKQKTKGILINMIEQNLESDALDLVQLYMLCYPNSSFCTNLPSPPPTGLDLVKKFCEFNGCPEIMCEEQQNAASIET